MPKRIDYRRRLLSAVDGFLSHVPSRIRAAHRTVAVCSSSLKQWSLDSFAWGPTLGPLRDSIYYQNDPYLVNLRESLHAWHFDLFRTYVSYDFVRDFTPIEQEWYASLLGLSDLLHSFPFTDFQEDPLAAYERISSQVRAAERAVPPPLEPGEETLPHLMLRDATHILTSLNLLMSMQRYGYLIPSAPYSALEETDDPPDATHSVAWAGRVLRAIAGNDRFLVVSQVAQKQMRIVLQ